MSELVFTRALHDAEPYDEFALVAENAVEMGVPWPCPHMPRRSRSRRVKS
jgi:hypothetical protein